MVQLTYIYFDYTIIKICDKYINISMSSEQKYGISNWPACVILPSKTGATTNCLNIQMPSISRMILMLIIGWILILVVAYIIYYFLNKNKPEDYKYSYWILLLVLVIACIIVSLINVLIASFL